MRKIVAVVVILVGFSSCQYVNSVVDTLKSNIKNSIEVHGIIPSVSLKSDNDAKKEKKDSVYHFTLSDFFAKKLGL